MAVMGCYWCHFVVWTKAGISIEEIAFDPILWEEHMLPKLLNFYKRHVMPEILTRRIQKSLLG
jgi:hypothetical protein